MLLGKNTFQRLVRHVGHNIMPSLRFEVAAYEVLQEAVESYLVTRFEDCVSCPAYAKQTTIMESDVASVLRIRGGRLSG